MQIIFKKHFPNQLKEIPNPPEKLYCRGDIKILKTPSLAIVGTRKISNYAKHITEKIVEELSNYNIAIISGLAQGVDAVAHAAALKNNLKTIAVLGSGINKIWPRSNLNLAEEISKKGLLISEFEPDQHPTKFTFPQRNRIVSGLSLATLVIQAPESSGALITARYALEQNRQIFTIPADLDRKDFSGNLKLIQKSGAYPISSAKEIIEELNLTKTKDSQQLVIPLSLTSEQQNILNLLSYSRGKTADEVSKNLKISISETLIQLSLLEIRGFVTIEYGRYLRV
ncbi:DNA-protecting protein DprA [Candidatus Peregrinibacteria bacterium CG10_big_fil_rev_8_21_14_0_10_36_19]|nr:MAG: DNA-protecting protein DprA [Candidatus Peregrinibacteria bacterium CG10_big_fil_rev_8_21_14_0_10_36_19]